MPDHPALTDTFLLTTGQQRTNRFRRQLGEIELTRMLKGIQQVQMTIDECRKNPESIEVSYLCTRGISRTGIAPASNHPVIDAKIVPSVGITRKPLHAL
jgi:hypothetical protein